MHILILNWRDPKNPKSGGAEIVTFRHAKAWIEAGHKVTWLTSRFKNSLKKETINGIEIVRKGNSLSVYLHAPFFYFFGGKTFDLVIDEIHGLPFFTPLYVRGKKIAFIHEVAQEIWDFMYSFPVNKFGKFLEKFYFKLYKNIPFWTDAFSTIDDLVRFGISRKLCIAIPCPIENEILNSLPIKEEKSTFIFVSRIVKMKGIEDVIKAFYLISKIIESQLWIVGGGDNNYIKKIKKIVSKWGLSKKIIFYGRVKDSKKLELMRRAHLLLHASIKEGWGLVVLEAASQGTPAVAYNVSGLKDTIVSGKTGLIVDQNTPELLAKKALDLLNNNRLYNKLQKNGLNWVKKFRWEDVTQESLLMVERTLRN